MRDNKILDLCFTSNVCDRCKQLISGIRRFILIKLSCFDNLGSCRTIAVERPLFSRGQILVTSVIRHDYANLQL